MSKVVQRIVVSVSEPLTEAIIIENKSTFKKFNNIIF